MRSPRCLRRSVLCSPPREIIARGWRCRYHDVVIDRTTRVCAQVNTKVPFQGTPSAKKSIRYRGQDLNVSSGFDIEAGRKVVLDRGVGSWQSDGLSPAGGETGGAATADASPSIRTVSARYRTIVCQEDHVKANRSLVVCGVIAVLLAGGCQASSAGTEEVVVGADLELSGPNANIGLVYAQALQLRVDQINRNGDLGHRKLTLVKRDNRSDPATSAANISALAADPSIKALITGACGACIVGAAKSVNEARIPTIALALATNVAAPVADRKYIFKLAPNADDDATVLVSELVTGGAKKIALVHSDDQFGTDANDALTSKFGRAGLTKVANQRAAAERSGVAAVADRVAKTRPDAGVILAYAPAAEHLSKARRAEDFTGRLMFGSGAAANLLLAGDT